MCAKNFQTYGIYIPRKCIGSRHFYLYPSPLKTLTKFLSLHPRQKEVTDPPGGIISKICFRQQHKTVEETMICFIKIQ